MSGHGCGVSQYPQFYDITKKINQMLPRPDLGRYSGAKGSSIFLENWILELAISVLKNYGVNK